MLWKQVNTYERFTPVPISLLLTTASSYDCSIFITNLERPINVKDYDELIRNLCVRGNSLIFCFDGADEEDAQSHIERLFRR